MRPYQRTRRLALLLGLALLPTACSGHPHGAGAGGGGGAGGGASDDAGRRASDRKNVVLDTSMVGCEGTVNLDFRWVDGGAAGAGGDAAPDEAGDTGAQGGDGGAGSGAGGSGGGAGGSGSCPAQAH